MGKDTTTIAGINDYSALKIIAETGTDLNKFKDEKHFTSWLGLASSAHQSYHTMWGRFTNVSESASLN